MDPRRHLKRPSLRRSKKLFEVSYVRRTRAIVVTFLRVKSLGFVQKRLESVLSLSPGPTQSLKSYQKSISRVKNVLHKNELDFMDFRQLVTLLKKTRLTTGCILNEPLPSLNSILQSSETDYCDSIH